MKTLITFYSLSGNNKKVCLKLQELIGGEVEELVDLVNRRGLWGFITGGRDAFLKRLTRIKPTEKNPQDYDLVILASPVWGGNITPALRTYLVENKERIKNYAFISVSGAGEQNNRVVKYVKEILGKEPLSSLFLREKEVKTGEYINKLEGFIKNLNI